MRQLQQPSCCPCCFSCFSYCDCFSSISYSNDQTYPLPHQQPMDPCCPSIRARFRSIGAETVLLAARGSLALGATRAARTLRAILSGEITVDYRISSTVLPLLALRSLLHISVLLFTLRLRLGYNRRTCKVRYHYSNRLPYPRVL